MTSVIITHTLSRNDIRGLQRRLLKWFQEHKRSFPWRETKNPFHLLIAEKLLQQTSASERVVQAYLLITEKYSNPKLLSKAKMEELRTIVSPLGLHYRAQELINLSKEVENQFSGNLPGDYKALMKLPGVGEYSARAVLSFAFNQKVAIVDTNVARVLFRIFGLAVPMPANPARKKFLIDLATTLIPKGKSREYNFALLDLSALICKPQNPLCGSCPINKYCFYFIKTNQ